jgi:hypothetical protein
MRSSQIVLATAVALTASGLTAAADAAPKKKPVPPVCMQVVDQSGDGKAYGVSDSPSLDILSGDIATGARNLVVAMRLSSLERDQLQVTGTSYLFTFTVSGVKQSVAYHLYATGEAIGRYDAAAGTGSVTEEVDVPVVADPVTKTITWTVPRKLVAELKKPGAKFSELSLKAWSAVNQKTSSGEGRSQLGSGDTAESVKTYTDFAPTCLKGT